jgi:hypothetical protein
VIRAASVARLQSLDDEQKALREKEIVSLSDKLPVIKEIQVKKYYDVLALKTLFKCLKKVDGYPAGLIIRHWSFVFCFVMFFIR